MTIIKTHTSSSLDPADDAPECQGACRLSDQVFITRGDAFRGEAASLAGCRLCGALHAFADGRSGGRRVLPLSYSVAAQRFGMDVDAIRQQLQVMAMQATPAERPPLWSIDLSAQHAAERIVGDARCFHAGQGGLRVVNRHIEAGQQWSCWTRADTQVPMQQRVRVTFRFSVSNQPVRLFAIGVGSGEDFASESMSGHFLQVYGDAVWTVAKGPEARCVPMQMSIRSGVVYCATFVVSATESHLHFHPAEAEAGAGFEHRISTVGWDAWQPMLLALSSSEVPDVAGQLTLTHLEASPV